MMKNEEITEGAVIIYCALNSGVLNGANVPRNMTIIQIIEEWEAKSNGKTTIKALIKDHDDGDKEKERNLTKSRITVVG